VYALIYVVVDGSNNVAEKWCIPRKTTHIVQYIPLLHDRVRNAYTMPTDSATVFACAMYSPSVTSSDFRGINETYVTNMTNDIHPDITEKQ
jgi:hypothetical protein